MDGFRQTALTVFHGGMGKSLAISMVCHAVFFFLTGDFGQEEPAEIVPIVVSLVAGSSTRPLNGVPVEGSAARISATAKTPEVTEKILEMSTRRIRFERRRTEPRSVAALSAPAKTVTPLGDDSPVSTEEEVARSFADSLVQEVITEPSQTAYGNSTLGTGDAAARAAGGAGTFGADDGPVVSGFGSREGPQVVHLAAPEYPLRAKRLHKEGYVLLRLHLDPAGQVKATEVVESAGYGFDESAVAAAKNSRFRPASRNGLPVACLALLPVRFQLQAAP